MRRRRKLPGCTCTSPASIERMQVFAEALLRAFRLPWTNKRRLAQIARRLHLLSKDRVERTKACPWHGELL